MVAEVVVLGGGYVGVWSARAIARRAAASEVRVTVVSMSPAHAYHGWTAEVITGHVRPERARVALAQLLPGARVVHAVVAGVDLDERAVHVIADEGSLTLPYDELIVGIGSRDAYERVHGLAEHGWSLKEDTGMGDLTAHLSDIVASAAATSDPVERRRLLTVVVAGGGFTGTEASAAIAQRLRAAMAFEPALSGARARVVLVTGSAELLPALRPRFERVADYAAAQAVQAGVELRRGVRLAAVDEAGARLDDGAVISSATVISTIGQTPAALPGTEHLARDASGRLVTDRELRVAPHVWAGGDIAAVPHPSGAGTCPTNALWAIHHGKRAGSNVVRTIRRRRPRRFRFPGLGQGASLGVGRGAAELYGVSVTGWLAWVLRWGFFHAYMPSHRVAVRTALEWFRPAARSSRTSSVVASRPETVADAAPLAV